MKVRHTPIGLLYGLEEGKLNLIVQKELLYVTKHRLLLANMVPRYFHLTEMKL